MNTQSKLAEIKAKCEKKAAEMARLELSAWNDNHEKELVEHFGFDKKSLAERKRELQKAAR